MSEGGRKGAEEMRFIFSVFTLLSVFPVHATACSCGVSNGDTVVQLKILTDRLNAQKIEVVDDRGQKRHLFKYEVAVLDVQRGNFKSNYILTGYGGGDCGIKFEQNSIATFMFWEKNFKALPLLGWCNIAKGT